MDLYLDPRISFGRPAITGKEVSMITISDLYEAEENIEDIADEYDCTPIQIKELFVLKLSRAARPNVLRLFSSQIGLLVNPS